MLSKDLDRRVQKTLQLLQTALAELIDEKEYDEITIQELLDRANVGRSTFYAHFENKDQLLRSLLNQVRERFDAGIEQLATGDKNFAEHSDQMPFGILELVEQNHRLFKAMLVQQGQTVGQNPFQDYLLILMREHFRLMLASTQSELRHFELVIHSYASAFMGALGWWLENDMPISAQELGHMMNQLILPGLESVFEDKE